MSGHLGRGEGLRLLSSCYSNRDHFSMKLSWETCPVIQSHLYSPSSRLAQRQRATWEKLSQYFFFPTYLKSLEIFLNPTVSSKQELREVWFIIKFLNSHNLQMKSELFVGLRRWWWPPGQQNLAHAFLCITACVHFHKELWNAAQNNIILPPVKWELTEKLMRRFSKHFALYTWESVDVSEDRTVNQPDAGNVDGIKIT